MALSGWLLLSLLGGAQAHDLRPGAIAVQQASDRDYVVRITEPVDGGRVVPVAPRWPRGCRQDGARLHCKRGLDGELSVPGLDERRVKVLVSVRRLDGSVDEGLLTEGQDRLVLGTPRRPWLELGLRHVLGGLDHLAFVFGLFLVARRRQLWGAVTAFTIGHSLTLGLTAAGVVAAPGAAIELLIALSVLLVAREALSPGPTLTRRFPWLVAGLFGLVHGVGFAGVLVELGLPGGRLLRPLVGFNVGVELGQLLALCGVLLAERLWQRRGWPGSRRLAAYAIGLPAGVWVVQRAVAWLSG